MKFTKNPKNLIYGRHPIKEALLAEKEFDTIFISAGSKSEELFEIRTLARRQGIQVKSVPEQKLKRLTNANHQGVAGFLSLIKFYEVEDILSQVYESGKLPLFIILDEIQDVRNFGAIVRSAHCFGANAIIIPEMGNAPVNADAIKASAGALTTFPICKVDSLKNTIEYLKENGLSIAVTTLEQSIKIQEADFNQPLAIVIGSEFKGVSKEILLKANQEINIPHQGNFDSLNASVAAGIILYEISRQRFSS